jgi:uncharacterized protein with von Willebrand factor type A (vWA) domain
MGSDNTFGETNFNPKDMEAIIKKQEEIKEEAVKPKRKRKYIPKVKVCSCCGSIAHGKFHYNF